MRLTLRQCLIQPNQLGRNIAPRYFSIIERAIECASSSSAGVASRRGVYRGQEWRTD